MGLKIRKFNFLYIMLIITIYLFVFQPALTELNPVFDYWDEFFAICFFPILFFRLIKFKCIKAKKIDFYLFLFCCLFLIIGLIPNIKMKFQGIIPVLLDILLNMKFYLAIFVAIYLFSNINFKKYRSKFEFHANITIVILFILMILDQIFKIFPDNGERFGLRSEQLFFGHPTGLAIIMFSLLLMSLIFAKDSKKNKKYLLMAILVEISTLRAKAIATSIAFLYLYIYMIILNKKLDIKSIWIIAILAVIVGWGQIKFYFLGKGNMTYARTALLTVSLIIMRKYFPFGIGFGTFASAPSAEYYSPVYYIYGLNNVWGLSKDYNDFVSDSFWPMIIGQTGALGFLCYVVILGILFYKIMKETRNNNKYKICGIGILMYLLISSTSESAFVNPRAVFLSLILGIIFIICQQEKSDKKILKNIID